MDTKFFLAALAAFAVAFILGFVFHGLVLAPDYMAHAAVYRGPDVGMRFPLLIAAQLCMAAAMTGLYRFGREDKPWLGQGARFGLLVACASVIPLYLIGYVVTNVSGALAVKQIILEAITVTVMGVVIAWFYRR
jgi:hypothetical protein